ncbi:Farnesyl pyrophosphate synthase [Frankliniella fusca]|uniref:Farnesyl pyrophosphate synthase n=1 Tax=Frankliniella fusca TaxID=407009 RepID=A0AAE1LTM4_9NEOP|nr:Farnesyl pyrophosphate synthase [Frankliniella fusca]
MRPLCTRVAALDRAYARAHRSHVASVHGAVQWGAPQPEVENQLAADRKELLSFFPILAKAVQAESQVVGISQETEWIGKLLHYVVPKGRLFRGCSALNACRELLPPDRAELGKPLGLAFEMVSDVLVVPAVTAAAPCHANGPAPLRTFQMQGYIVMMDDLVDESTLRRGVPCWHTLPGIGLHAVNDAFLLHTSVFKVLQRYFRAEPSYAYLFELLNEVGTVQGSSLTPLSARVQPILLQLSEGKSEGCRNACPAQCIFRAAIAQNYECHNGSPGSGAVRFDDFDHAVHSAQAFYKLSYYSFYAPLAAALHLAGASDRPRHKALWRITKDLGLLFVVQLLPQSTIFNSGQNRFASRLQDDYSDCYESEAVSGKTQSDIRNGKCTWLVAEAKRRANESQLALLKENYGYDDAEKVAAVMDLYAQLGVQEAADEYIRSGYARIAKEIDSQQHNLPPGMLHYTLANMRKRVPSSLTEIVMLLR